MKPYYQDDAVITIRRVWAMPNRWTFQIPPIRELLTRYVGDGKGWVDPFAGMSSLAEFTNDLNPEMPAGYHLEALEFIKQFKCQYFVGALLDPPYSPRQVKECYNGIGIKMAQTDALLGYTRKKWKQALAQVLLPDAIAISCGWNTVGMGKGLGFEIIEILIVCHGSDHNDTIITVERKKAAERMAQTVMDLTI